MYYIDMYTPIDININKNQKKKTRKEILFPRLVNIKLWKVFQTTYIKTTSLQVSCVSSHGEVGLQT